MHYNNALAIFLQKTSEEDYFSYHLVALKENLDSNFFFLFHFFGCLDFFGAKTGGMIDRRQHSIFFHVATKIFAIQSLLRYQPWLDRSIIIIMNWILILETIEKFGNSRIKGLNKIMSKNNNSEIFSAYLEWGDLRRKLPFSLEIKKLF